MGESASGIPVPEEGLNQYMGEKAPTNMYPNGKVPTAPTSAEAKLVNSFQTYIQARRTYVAQQGLNMYDPWYSSTQQYSPPGRFSE